MSKSLLYTIFTHVHRHNYIQILCRTLNASTFQELQLRSDTDIASTLKSKSLRFAGRLVNAVATAAWYARERLKVCEAYHTF